MTQANLPKHLGVAQFYDLPILSSRNHLLPQILKDEKIIPQMFVASKDVNPNNLAGVDLRHVSSACCPITVTDRL